MRIVLMLALLLSAGSARADIPPPPPRHAGDAGAVAKQLIAAMGGDAAWQRARYFRFDAIFEREGMAPFVRSHYWDRKTGRYRFDGNGDEGAYRVYFNVNTNTRQGDVWLGGKKLTDAAKVKKWLDTAYEAYARDTTWLLVPFRMFDRAAVALEYEDLGRGASGGSCDILRIDVGPLVTDGVREHYAMCVDQKVAPRRRVVPRLGPSFWASAGHDVDLERLAEARTAPVVDAADARDGKAGAAFRQDHGLGDAGRRRVDAAEIAACRERNSRANW